MGGRLTRREDEEAEREGEEAAEHAPAPPKDLPTAILGMQRGAGNASVARLLARKAQVDLPGWGDNLVGDDDTDVTFDPTGSYMTAAGADIMNDPLSNYGKIGGAVQAGDLQLTGMPLRAGYGGELNIKAGTRGTVKIAIKAHWFFDQKVNDEYDQEFSCSWDVEADKTGKLTIGKANQSLTPMGSEAPFQLSALNPDTGDASVQISPQWQSFQNTDIPNVQLSVGAEKGPVQGGAGVTLGNERTYPAGSLVRTFDLKLKVVDIPKPEPQVRLGPITMQRHATHDVLFEKPKQHKVSRDQEEKLLLWYTSLSPETRKALREGTLKVKMDGYASSTDKAPNNRELARNRVESAKGILRDFGAKQFDDAAYGEYVEGVGEPEGEVESQDERRVALEVIEEPVEIYPGDDAAGVP